jgi:hypothetical protein
LRAVVLAKPFGLAELHAAVNHCTRLEDAASP